MAIELNVLWTLVPSAVTAPMMTDGDQGGDEAIFDGRDTGLILDEAAKQICHKLNSSNWGYLTLQIVCSTGSVWNDGNINKQGFRCSYGID